MNKYQSLVAWRQAHAFVVALLRTTDRHYHPRARPLFDQLRRSAVSVEANIVEGYALGTTPWFRRHLRIALGSAAEAECLLRLAAEVQYLPPDVTPKLEAPLSECISTIRGLLKSLPCRR